MKDRINQDFMSALKSGDRDRKNFLGLIKGEIELQEKRGDVDVDGILKKMEKSLKATNDAEAQKQLVILQEYLPQMMDAKEVISILSKYHKEGFTTLPLLMKKFNEEHKGKADNQLVMQTIKEIV